MAGSAEDMHEAVRDLSKTAVTRELLRYEEMKEDQG